MKILHSALGFYVPRLVKTVHSILLISKPCYCYCYCYCTLFSETKSKATRYACMVAAVIALLFYLTLNGSAGSEAGDSLRSGQAKRPTIHSVTGLSGIGGSKKDGFSASFDGEGGDFEETDTDMEMEATVEAAQDDFSKAVRERLEANQLLLSKSFTSVNDLMRSNLNDILGDDDNFEQEDIDRIANDIEAKLSNDVLLELKDRAKDLKEDATVNIEDDVDLETEGNNGEEGPIDLTEEEKRLVVDLKDGIDDAAAKLRTDMVHRCALITKEILEIALETKLGSPYEVKIGSDDQIVSYKKKKSSVSSTSTTKKTPSHHSSSHHTSSHHTSSHHHTVPTKHSTHKKKKKKYVSPSVSESESESESVSESESEEESFE
jgi:hypothetical protein